MSALRVPQVTPEEYLAFERTAEFKSEYFDGQIFAMAGAAFEHWALTANLNVELAALLAGSRCFAGSSDLKVRTSPSGLYTYPDLVVYCGKPEFADDAHDTLVNPSLLIEILSESTEAKDRGFKFEQYQQIASLGEYVLVSQRKPRIEVFRRLPSGRWELSIFEGIEAVVRLESVNCELPLARVYREPWTPRYIST